MAKQTDVDALIERVLSLVDREVTKLEQGQEANPNAVKTAAEVARILTQLQVDRGNRPNPKSRTVDAEDALVRYARMEKIMAEKKKKDGDQ